MTEQQPELNPDGPDLADLALGLPGPAEDLPDGDADQDGPVEINAYDDEDEA